MTPANPAKNQDPVLPDIVAPGLSVLFCGSAAGAASARAGAYYAGPGNKFWRILAETGLTPRQLDPSEFTRLPEWGMGLTDMAKHVSGSDASLPKQADDPAGLTAKLEQYQPATLTFVGKRAAQIWLGHMFNIKKPDYGRQDITWCDMPVFVMPSTSGAANGFWHEEPWFEMADHILKIRGNTK